MTTIFIFFFAELVGRSSRGFSAERQKRLCRIVEMQWSSSIILLFTFLIISNAKNQKTTLCGTCDKDSCPDVSGCEQLKKDQCDCCEVSNLKF